MQANQKVQELQETTSADLMQASVKFYGEAEADLFCAVVPNNVTFHGDMKTKRALVVSLFGSVILESLVQRAYLNNENFDDSIPLPAKISALETTLDILAKEHVMFAGGQTYSAQHTYAEALANIYDLPITLVTQRVSRWSDGFSRDTYGHQFVSRHEGGGGITTFAHGQQHLCAPNILLLIL